jgi:hypothetical protein
VKRRSLLIVPLLLVTLIGPAGAQVIMRPGGNASGVTIIEPTWEPPYRLTIQVYVTAQDGRPVVPGLGANVLVIDPQGRRTGMDEGGILHQEIPRAAWQPLVNPQPTAPIGPRGLGGSGVTLEDAADGGYVLEIAGTERVSLDLAVAQWDKAGRRRWLHLAKASTEPGAVDRWDIPYTAAARPAFDLAERRDDSYLSVRVYGRRSDAVQEPVTELLISDPRGRRLGRDPTAKQDYQEIPRGAYGGGTGPVEARELELMRLAAGAYALDVIGTTAGRYELIVYAADRAGRPPTSLEGGEVPTRAGLIHRYRLEWPDAPGGEPRLAGAWGQGDRLLSYAYPVASRTEVPAGQTSVALVVFYAPGVVAGSFHATLGGRDVTARFHPAPDGHEAVTLPLAPGSNALVLSVTGTMPDGRTSTHTDSLELVRRR